MNNSHYSDIINLPRHTSEIRPRMPFSSRAAQFSSFAALTGFEDVIEETARHTESRPELDENAVEILDRNLSILSKTVSEHPEITITYFRADEKKTGGAYITLTGPVKKIDEFERAVLLVSGERIEIGDITEIEIL